MKRKYFKIYAISFFLQVAVTPLIVSQTNPSAGSVARFRQTTPPPSDKNVPIVYKKGDTPPVFPGGESGFIRYMYSNLQYPVQAQHDSVQARLMIRFEISDMGKVRNPTVEALYVGKDLNIQVEKTYRRLSPTLKRTYDDMRAEAIRVVKNMPDWKPCVIDGKKIQVYNTIPVFFVRKAHLFGMKNYLTLLDGTLMPLDFSISVINQSIIESLRVRHDSVLMLRYGSGAKDGVLELKLRK